MVGGGGIEFEHLFDQPTIEPERRGLRPSGARAPLDETLSGQPREPSAPLTALARSFRDPVLRWCALFVPEFLPQPLEATLGEVRAWADRDHGGLPAAERAAWLSGLRQLVDATEAVFTQVLEPFDAHGDGDTLHAARSTGSWLQGALRLAPGDAAQRVRIARRASGALAEPVTALTTGSLTFDQVRAIERAVRSLPLETEVAAVDLLVDLAGRVDAGRLRVAGRAMRYAVDPDGALVDAQTQFDRRYLHLSPLLDGMTAVDGLLDAESTVVQAAALAPFLVPSDPDDERSTAQRRADGLIDVVRAAAATGDLPVLSGAPPTLEVVVPFDALVGAPGAAPGVVRGSPGGDALLTSVAVGRLACDAVVRRVLLGPDSLPLDVGRALRLFTPHQRRALAIRDEGCRFPGCGRPSGYTDAHHLVSWSNGGSTDLVNGVLLCRHHHRAVHEVGWRIEAAHTNAGANGALDFIGPRGQVLRSPVRGP